MCYLLPILVCFNFSQSPLSFLFRPLISFQLLLLLSDPLLYSFHSLSMFSHFLVSLDCLHFHANQLLHVLFLFLAQFFFISLPSLCFTFLSRLDCLGCFLLLSLFNLLVMVIVDSIVLHLTVLGSTSRWPRRNTTILLSERILVICYVISRILFSLLLFKSHLVLEEGKSGQILMVNIGSWLGKKRLRSSANIFWR